MALLSPDMAQRLSGLANTAQSVGVATPQTQAIAAQAQQAQQAPLTNPYAWINDVGGYANPAKGAVKYGVGFGTGLGGDAQTQQIFGKAPDLAGLWAMGFDQSDPNNNAKLWAFHQDKMKTDQDYKNYVTKEASKNNWNLNDIQGITYGADWYYRDLARRMGKSNNFLDSTLGKIIATAGQIGLGFVPGVGPALSAGLGAYTGQRNGGGILGGLLGAAGGYGAGKLGANIAANGLSNTISSGLNSIQNLFGGGELTSINQYFPADIAKRAITSASLLPLGAAARLGQSGLNIPSPNKVKNITDQWGDYTTSSSGSGNYADVAQPTTPQTGNPLGGLATGLLAGIPLISGQTSSPTQQSASTSSQLALPTLATAEADAGILGPGWGGKFDKFKSPYRQTQLTKSRVRNAFRSA